MSLDTQHRLDRAVPYDGGVAIMVKRVGALYAADVTPPHDGGDPWESGAPMCVDDLVAELLSRGCHQTDIGDAFYAADPEWLPCD
jgi:hypothetical protein